MTEGETGYERMKRIRYEKLESSIRELEQLADQHAGKSHYLSQEAFKHGLMFAIRAIEDTEALHIKAMAEVPYANPKEAEREHKNQMNTLAVIKSRLINRHRGCP